MPSKMVLDRHRREKSLRGLVKELRGKTVEGVVDRLAPYADEGVDLAGCVDGLLGALERLLEDHSQQLMRADEQNVATAIRLKRLRRERDEAARELRATLVEIREIAAFFFGREVGNKLVDVRGPTARAHHRDRLMSQVRRALDSLRDPATEIPEPRKGVELPADLKQRWIGNLETARAQLQDALDEIKAGDLEMGRARHKKGVRIELHDDEVSAIANLQEALLILGRKPDAARIIWEKQRPVGRPVRQKKTKPVATKPTGKRSQAKTTTQLTTSKTSPRKMSSREVAKS